MILNIIGDTHNTEYLKMALDAFDNIISIGDMSFMVEGKDNNKENLKKLGICLKAYINNELKNEPIILSKKDRKWFKKILFEYWKRQLNNIKMSKKEFTICFGNAEYYLVNYFKECSEYLYKIEKSSSLKSIQKPSIEKYDGIQIIFLPFSYSPFNIKSILNKIDKTKKLFVLGHCPAYKKHKKFYYENYYNVLKLIQQKYNKELIYIHSHIHPDDTYLYKIRGLSKIQILAPKAEDNLRGFGVDNHIIQLDTKTGEFKVIDMISKKEIKVKKLPEKYLISDHWNKFEK